MRTTDHEDTEFVKKLTYSEMEAMRLRGDFGFPDQYMKKLPLFKDKSKYSRLGDYGIQAIDTKGIEDHFL